MRVAVLVSETDGGQQAVAEVADRLRGVGHEVRVGAVTSHDAVREVCLGVDVVVGTPDTEEVAAAMAEFTGVPGVVLLSEPRRRGHRRERARWLAVRSDPDALRRVLLLEPSRRPAYRTGLLVELYADVPAYVCGRIGALVPYRASQAAYASNV